MTAWTTPASWTGSPSETFFNTHIRDNLNHLSEQINLTGWTSFTPSWTNLTVGNGTNAGKYAYAGKTVFFYTAFTLGSTSSVGSAPVLTLPQTSIDYGTAVIPIGEVFCVDTGTATYYGSTLWTTTTTATPRVGNASGTYLSIVTLSATVPFTWATGDILMMRGSYERA